MKYKTIFISDLHLGGACNYPALTRFLYDNDAETWYIIGDFLDFWAVMRSKQWPQEASNVLQIIINKAKHGSKVYILPGNHDSHLRTLDGFKFGNVEIHDRMTHYFSNGSKAVLLHGDVFDSVIGHAVWLAKIGSIAYDTLIKLNSLINWFRRLFRMPYWSFSAAIKKQVKDAVNYVSDFRASLIEYAKEQQAEYVICGHIHTAETAIESDVTYINTGDWVESLTAFVETKDGTLELKHYGH